jgi:aminoglycoside 6-adenylyltransferase
VYLNGSRANPNIHKDNYQDYDIVYVVTETQSFLDDKRWMSVFGDPAIIQEPDSNDFGWGIHADFSRSYAWLMLFKDGNRIDLTIKTKEAMLEHYQKDSLTVPLMDKDHILLPLPPSSDKDYHVKRPGEAQYKGCCNEFWWCLNNVAKGIARDQLCYAMWMFNGVVRDMLVRMMNWYIGINTEFSVNVGMSGKYFKKYLPDDLYERFARTYSDSEYANLWKAVFTSCDLFRSIARPVADYFGYTYNSSDDENMVAYLHMVKEECGF